MLGVIYQILKRSANGFPRTAQRVSVPTLWPFLVCKVTCLSISASRSGSPYVYKPCKTAWLPFFIQQFFFSSKRMLLHNPIMSVDKVIIRAGNGINMPQTGDKVRVTYTGWLYDPDQADKGKEYVVDLDLVMTVFLIAKMRFKTDSIIETGLKSKSAWAN
jgi:hypothetical protein